VVRKFVLLPTLPTECYFEPRAGGEVKIFLFYTDSQTNKQSPVGECRSVRLGFCGLLCTYAPPACVPAVLEGLVVWRHYKPKTKKQKDRKNFGWLSLGLSLGTWGTIRRLPWVLRLRGTRRGGSCDAIGGWGYDLHGACASSRMRANLSNSGVWTLVGT